MPSSPMPTRHRIGKEEEEVKMLPAIFLITLINYSVQPHVEKSKNFQILTKIFNSFSSPKKIVVLQKNLKNFSHHE